MFAILVNRRLSACCYKADSVRSAEYLALGMSYMGGFVALACIEVCDASVS